MLTIFSMAEARYFPVTLQDRGDRDGSLGDPMEVPPSSDEPLLRSEEENRVHHFKFHLVSSYEPIKIFCVIF